MKKADYGRRSYDEIKKLNLQGSHETEDGSGETGEGLDSSAVVITALTVLTILLVIVVIVVVLVVIVAILIVVVVITIILVGGGGRGGLSLGDGGADFIILGGGGHGGCDGGGGNGGGHGLIAGGGGGGTCAEGRAGVADGVGALLELCVLAVAGEAVILKDGVDLGAGALQNGIEAAVGDLGQALGGESGGQTPLSALRQVVGVELSVDNASGSESEESGLHVDGFGLGILRYIRK
jgi:hypothetical protein